MNQMDELKKKSAELLDFARRIIGPQVRKWADFLRVHFAERGARVLLAGVIAIFVLGFFIGSIMTKGAGGGEGFSLLRYLFGRKVTVQGTQQDGSFLFSNFEKDSDLGVWKLQSAKLELSRQYAAEGSRSAKIIFSGGEKLSSVGIEEYFLNPKGLHDWSRYDTFNFYLANPGKSLGRVILQIRDQSGSRFKEDLEVDAEQGRSFTISIQKIAAFINVHRIDQISFFVWDATRDQEFYLDYIRLIPAGLNELNERTGLGSSGTQKERPVNMLDYGFSQRKSGWLFKDPALIGEAVRVPFVVKNETGAFCHLCPVEGGIPFPIGELTAFSQMRLRNAQKEEIAFQPRVLARWPDQSVKWLGLHFATTLQAGEDMGFFLEYGGNIRAMDFSSDLHVSETPESIHIQTGKLDVLLSKKTFYLFERVSLDQNQNGTIEPEEEMVSKAALTLGFKGREYRTDLAQDTYRIELEERGTQRVVVKASGWFVSEKGHHYCQAIVRYYFYAGRNEVKVSDTLIYTGYPENRYYGVYEGLKLPANETIESFGLRLPFSFSSSADRSVQIGKIRLEALEFSGKNSVRLVETGWEEAMLNGETSKVSGDNAYAGWMDVSDAKQGVTVAIRNFRENYPKAFSVDDSRGEIQVDLWPKEAGELDLATTAKARGPDDAARGNAFGLGKTHELLFYFHPKNAFESEAAAKAGSFMKRLVLRTNPYWVDATGALGRLFPVDSRYAREEKILENLFDWADRHPRNFNWYGMLNFGDTLTWWRNEDDENHYDDFGWHPIGRWGWYNCEGVGTHTGALLQFVRSGQWKYFEFGENLARHLMDVDTIHYNTIANDRRLRKILNDEFSQIGSMHRHSGDHWSGRSEEASHTNVWGILLYHYVTGDERAMDVAKEIGEFFLKEPFTYTQHPEIAPHRAMANALWGDVLLYEATADERFKRAADKIVDIYLKGQQSDGSFLENYNLKNRTWSGDKHELYMSGYLVGALIAYHELTQDEDVREMLLKLVRYLAPTEYSGPVILNGLAYAYLITHDQFFISMAQDNMKIMMTNAQQSQTDPFMNGLVYKKPIYHRPMAFLSTVPYVFGAFEESFRERGR